MGSMYIQTPNIYIYIYITPILEETIQGQFLGDV